jgi:hypothetical protein
MTKQDTPRPFRRHLATDEARAGTTPHIVRHILGISLVWAFVGH